MTIVWLLIIAAVGVATLVFLDRVVQRRPSALNKKYFERKWVELLARVKTTDGMVLAIIEADKLLDEALKKHHYRGKSMGERLVSAQKTLSDNDAVWYAHKMRNRLVHEPNSQVRKNEAKQALQGIRKGLKDLGALE